MDAATISLIAAAAAIAATVVASILTYWFQRQSKEVRETTSRTALDLRTVILADEEDSKRILFRIEDYLQTMRSFQESLEKPLQQERQEIRALSKSLAVTVKDYEDILSKLSKEVPDLNYLISDQFRRMAEMLDMLSDLLRNDLDIFTKRNMTAMQVLNTDIQQLGAYLQN